MERKLHELENGEFRAEQLSELVSRDEIDPDTLLPVWDAKGHITVKTRHAKAQAHWESRATGYIPGLFCKQGLETAYDGLEGPPSRRGTSSRR